MDEIITLSSDSSYPPSPEFNEAVHKVNECLENSLISEKKVNSSVSACKRPVNHPFSSSDESDNSLPSPPSFDAIPPKRQSFESGSVDINVFHENIGYIAQTNDNCGSSTDVIGNSSKININASNVKVNESNVYHKVTGIAGFNLDETNTERNGYRKLSEEKEFVKLGHTNEKDVNSSVSIRKRPASHPFSSSDESDDSIPVPPSYDAVLPKEQSVESNSSDLNLSSEEISYISQNYICSNNEIINNSSEINLRTNNVEVNDDNLYEKITGVCDLNVEKVNEKKSNATKKNCRKLSEEEKRKMKLEQAREKALKKASSLALKNKKAGECLKNIQAMLDQRLLTEEYGGDILLSLKNSNMLYEIQEQLVPKTVTWIKFINNYHVDDDMKILTTTNSREECNILVIMSAHEIVELVDQNKLRYYIKDMTTLLANKKITIVIYKLSEYYRLQNLHNQRKFKAHCRGQQYHISTNEEYKVSRDAIEKALLEIQIFESCCHKFVETSPELGSLIAQVTKALAERDFKLEKRKEEDLERSYAEGNACKKIKVDKSGNGLLSLWKRHICVFNNVNIDVSEAVVSSYPSPSSLIQAYDNCSTSDGRKLLEDIRIRRAPGPLTSVKTVGKALSNSVCNFFSSSDGDSQC